VIRKYYPDLSEDELKEIQEIVYLLSCTVMQQFYRSKWMGGFEESEQSHFRYRTPYQGGVD